jgi:hypothetical protein
VSVCRRPSLAVHLCYTNQYALCLGDSHCIWLQDGNLTIYCLYFVSLNDYNFACCSVWVWNLVAHTAEGAEAEGVYE